MQTYSNTNFELLANESGQYLPASSSNTIAEEVAVQRPPGYSLTSDPLVIQGGIAIAVILAITFLVEALAKLVKASHQD